MLNTKTKSRKTALSTSVFNSKTTLLFLSLLMATITSAQSIVEEHGQLRVSGNKVVNKDNQPISLAGNSLFWSNYSEGAKFYNAETVNHLATDWKTDIVRAAMGVENTGGYISNPTTETNKVKAVVDAAINAGVYVIIDWHSHNAEQYQAQAIQFFTEMSQLYGNNDNVIYEVYNEPIAQSWPTIKSYAEAVIDAIRVNDPDNLIIVGTRTWSQQVEEASNNPINKSNIAYTLHFYAGTHKESLRNNAVNAMNNGIALFVTEWGAVNADGNGAADIAETNLWMDFLKDNDISHTNWSVSDKDEGASVIAPNTGVSGLVSNNLTATGTFIKNIIETWNDTGGNDEQTPYKTLNIPGIIEAEDYDNGGENIAYSDTNTNNSGGQYRTDGVDIENTADTSGEFNVGWTANGEWMEYTIASVTNGDYNINFRVASPSNTSKSIKITLDNTELGIVSVPNTGNWQIWQDITLTNVNVSGGSDLVLRLDIIGGNYNINWVEFEAVNTTPIPVPTTCDSSTSISLPFSKDGIGSFCWVTSGSITNINSWGLEKLEINGVDFTNIYSNTFPNKIDGNYYIYYTSNNSWSHFEIDGFGGNSAKLNPNHKDTSSIVSIYPNPSKNEVYINLKDKLVKKGSIKLYNNIGTLIKSWDLKNTEKTLNIQDLASGIYYINIINNGEVTNKKIIKE